MAIYPKYMRSQVSLGNTAEFAWFFNLFQLCKSLHETTLKILSLAYCILFTYIIAAHEN